MTNDRSISRSNAFGTVDQDTVSRASAQEFRHPTTGLPGVLTAAFQALAGAAQDRATAWTLSRKSDRVLADMGFDRDTLVADLAAGRKSRAARRGALPSQRLAAWREERRIYQELSRYSDAELAELGMARGDIRAAARGHAVLLFRDADFVGRHFQADGGEPAANQVAGRHAA